MATISFLQFSGVAPKLTAWNLPPSMAQTALDVNLESRTLRPWKATVASETGLAAADPSTIYRFGLSLVSDTQYWFTFLQDVDLVKGPVVNDTSERTYYTGVGAPKWTNSTLALTGGPPYPVTYRDLGVAAPGNTPTVTITGVGTGTAEDRAYVYTNVTAYWEESAPSPASAIVTVVPGQTVTVTNFSAAPVGTSSTTARRLYRAVTSITTTTTDYFFVKEFLSTDTSVVDDATTLGEPLQTSGWIPPPSTMFGVTAMANGVLVGFNGNDVCISESYIPYAWPLAYVLSTDYPIVGGKAIGNQVVVLTTGNPYMLSGTDPSSMTLTKLNWPQGCVSKRSIVNIGGAIAYASPDGLCAVDGSGNVTNMTDSLMARADWQALSPSSVHGYYYNNRYYGFYNTGVASGGFVFEPSQNDAALAYTSTYATAGYADLVQDALFLKVSTSIVKWNSSGAYGPYDWRSGVFTLPKPTNFGAGQVFASAYPVTFKIYGDGVLQWTQTVNSSSPFRLPGGYRSRQVEVEISGSNEVYRAYLGSTVLELQNV